MQVFPQAAAWLRRAFAVVSLVLLLGHGARGEDATIRLDERIYLPGDEITFTATGLPGDRIVLFVSPEPDAVMTGLPFAMGILHRTVRFPVSIRSVAT